MSYHPKTNVITSERLTAYCVEVLYKAVEIKVADFEKLDPCTVMNPPHRTQESFTLHACIVDMVDDTIILSLIPLRPPGFPLLIYFPAYFLSSKFELFEVHVCKECLAFLLVYSWKVDTCSDVST
ncbi:hypothetical protein POTOM_058639 [Populus tomentosa]|uniref:Uncharacterized protein n=1 Tax=Populus tomentosa TaxID=118781 RepID=A0A8X7XVL2_POPTO|nr:hypothetical protein POTOM_058639 [Populus tomentosa]